MSETTVTASGVTPEKSQVTEYSARSRLVPVMVTIVLEVAETDVIAGKVEVLTYSYLHKARSAFTHWNVDVPSFIANCVRSISTP